MGLQNSIVVDNFCNIRRIRGQNTIYYIYIYIDPKLTILVTQILHDVNNSKLYLDFGFLNVLQRFYVNAVTSFRELEVFVCLSFNKLNEHLSRKVEKGFLQQSPDTITNNHELYHKQTNACIHQNDNRKGKPYHVNRPFIYIYIYTLPCCVGSIKAINTIKRQGQ